MKDKVYTDIICKGFCKYYKEGKEDILCRGYVFLRENLTDKELKSLIYLSKPEPDVSFLIPDRNKELENLICSKCDFLIDGCDYAENLSAPPCGGYIIIKFISDSLII